MLKKEREQRQAIAGGHALGIHGQNLFFNILADAGLILFYSDSQNVRQSFTLVV